MADWFEFAGVRSTDRGVFVQDFPPLTLSEERVDFAPVPGRSGSLTRLEGLNVREDINQSINCFVLDLEALDQIAVWLRGAGRLVLGNRPDRYYLARVINHIEMAQVMRGRKLHRFPVVFRCGPFRYAYPEPGPLTLTSSPGSVNNPGTIDAYPLITIVGSGDVVVTIGGKTLTVTGLASQITFDTETGFAVDGFGVDKTGTASLSAWPLSIPPGISVVSWTGTVTSVGLTRPWRYI